MSTSSEILNIDVVELKHKQNVWTQEEHAKMLDFMDESRDFLLDNLQRNISKVNRSNKAHFFVRMSACIGTKTDKQCKSRYQKKESQLLRELNFCPALVDSYVRTKREKNRKPQSHQESPQSTDVSQSMVKAEEPSGSFIGSFEELKAVIIAEFMPRVKNEVVMTHLRNFIQSFPCDDSLVKKMPSLSISPLRFFQPSMGFSIDLIPDPEIIFLEDCD